MFFNADITLAKNEPSDLGLKSHPKSGGGGRDCRTITLIRHCTTPVPCRKNTCVVVVVDGDVFIHVLVCVLCFFVYFVFVCFFYLGGGDSCKRNYDNRKNAENRTEKNGERLGQPSR